MGWNFLSSLLKYWSIFSVVFVAVQGSSPKILSVTRSKDKGDSFEVDLESSSCPASCKQLGAVSRAVNGGNGSGCSCHCADKTRPTFYRKHSGQHGCVKDRDVLTDTQGNICDFYTSNAQQLQVLNLHVGGNSKLKPDGFCDEVQISSWKFYFNRSWMFSKSNIFSARSFNKGKAFLVWNDHLDSFYEGLLIKVIVRCTYQGKSDDRCLMLKAQGTHHYFEIPKAMPSQPPSSSSFPTEKNKNGVQKSSISLVESTKFNTDPAPTGDYSEANDKQIWIAVSLGVAGVVLIVIIVITVFLVLKCRRNCKKERRGSHQHPTEQPATPAVCSSLHDYEYVHYPCLVDGIRTRPVTPKGNPLYERGRDNKLIIWTPGHSGSLTRPNDQSADTSAPRLPYQRLLTRMSSSSPDCSGVVTPVSPPGVEEVFPYQKLVRTLPSQWRDQQGCGHSEGPATVGMSSPEVEESLPYQRLFRSMPSLRREEQGCGHTEQSAAGLNREESPSKAYQSLSLERYPLYSVKECDGYAKVDVPSRPESLEYDYARVSVELDPVELKKLFRGLQNEAEEMPRASLEISIGDLDNTASSPDTDLKQSSGVSVKCSVSTCTGDYENCLYKNITKENCSTGTDEDGEGVKPTDLRPAASYEDLSGGCRIDPEEYTEMGKRRSTLIVEGNDSTDHEVEDNGHEYFVLERVIESTEGETVDES